MWIFRSVSLMFTIIGIVITTATAWFVPWVFTLHLGALVYFPYKPRSEERFMRITGPWAGSYSKNWVNGRDIPKSCKLALVAAEDTKFFFHHGIDLESLEKSYEYNQRKKKTKRGGSTITQQLVKNAFLSRDRSYIRKAREIIGAMLLDATASKDFQLNWYFNIVEFGPNIYGIKDAAQFYFKKPPTALTQRECASLVAILPSPNRWNKSLKSGYPSGFLAARVGTIMARMKVIPTDEAITGRTAAIAAGSRKNKDLSQPNGKLDGLPAPETPAALTPLQQLEQAEIQSEKAEQLDLPEETDTGAESEAESAQPSSDLEDPSKKSQQPENTDFIEQ